jgi:drug/metabolite transporter (DMT)-like permease
MQMKIALKYGLLITLVVVLWVVIARFLLGITPESKADLLAPILFNLAAIVSIYAGIKASMNEREDPFRFKDGVKTGFAISLVYAFSSCMFFFIVFLVSGPALLANEPMAKSRPLWQVALLAYLGLFGGALAFGLVYATIISFFLVRQKQSEVT